MASLLLESCRSVAAPTDDAQNATALAHRHPGWIVWISRPTAARTHTGAPPPRNDGVWAATVEAESYAELDAKLTEQDQADTDARWTQT